MKFGAHVSIAGGVDLAPDRAKELGCECFQFFSRSPRGGKAPELTDEIVENFKNQCQKYSLESYIHTPYYINFASANSRIYYGSITVVREELERGSKLGVKYVITHLGSAKDLGEEEALQMTAKGIEKMLEDYMGTTEFLIELSAGAGMIMGNTFEEIKNILDRLPVEISNKIGICFDTQHSFASGYDLRSDEKVKEVFDQFDKVLGLSKLKLLHGNDSKTEFFSRKDRHEHIGKGKIGLEGFMAIVNDSRLSDINMIVETPHDGVEKDLSTLKKLRQ